MFILNNCLLYLNDWIQTDIPWKWVLFIIPHQRQLFQATFPKRRFIGQRRQRCWAARRRKPASATQEGGSNLDKGQLTFLQTRHLGRSVSFLAAFGLFFQGLLRKLYRCKGKGIRNTLGSLRKLHLNGTKSWKWPGSMVSSGRIEFVMKVSSTASHVRRRTRVATWCEGLKLNCNYSSRQSLAYLIVIANLDSPSPIKHNAQNADWDDYEWLSCMRSEIVFWAL